MYYISPEKRRKSFYFHKFFLHFHKNKYYIIAKKLGESNDFKDFT